MKRESGYYWVQDGLLNWIIAEWEQENGWYLPGEFTLYYDGDFVSIDERPITRKPVN